MKMKKTFMLLNFTINKYYDVHSRTDLLSVSLCNDTENAGKMRSFLLIN